MRGILLSVILLYSCLLGFGQATNISCTHPLAESILLGNYNPSTYQASSIINHPDSITKGINLNVNADSLKAYIIQLASFGNRNSGSDTNSTTFGFGAARNWVYSKFQQYSVANENRLIPSFLKFDQNICSMTAHKNVLAILPGMDTSDKRIIIIEGHMDSRCEGNCDVLCNAQGVEDNASGTALVMELARIMSKYSFNHTIVFMVTTAEEQGLYGAEAMADYVQSKGILVKCVQNNDVIGGVICGQTSSAPSCPGLGDIDSTHVRLFSYGNFNSAHKQFSRFIKLEYQEELLPLVTVPMDISIMTPEDRTGRGGDHIPFRQHLYTAMRFTSANEHGNADVTDPGYTDRQHTTRDTLGMDTNGDMVVDSFFVDFNYLARNATINANAAGMAAIGPKTPNFTVVAAGTNLITVTITDQTQYDVYRVAVRTNTHDWDTVFYMNDTVGTFSVNPWSIHYISTASMDTDSVESLFSVEKAVSVPTGSQILTKEKGMVLLPNKPNPFDESTTIGVMLNEEITYKEAAIVITDLNGKALESIPLELRKGLNEVNYNHGYGVTGTYIYTLIVDGKRMQSGRMIFAN